LIERPIDLTTIKHKIMMGLYAEAADFNRDMHLLFANALFYTQHQPDLNALLLKVSTNYHRSFKQLAKYSRKKAKTPAKPSHPALRVRNLDREDEEVYDEAFTRADIELFARCLSELSSRNKSALIRAFCKKHTDVIFHDKTTIALSGLTACQLYDLL
jgi:hypothetical protein